MVPMTRYEGQSSLVIRRFLEVPLRRPWHVLVPLVLVVAGAVAASRLVQKRYRSSTLILVEKEKVPESVVPRARGEDSSPRLFTIKQEILSRTRLERVVKELDPYPDQAAAPLTHLLDRMRAATNISVKGSDAFTVEFEHEDPEMAMRVADRLATLFIDETVAAQESRVADATQFIESELEEARRQVEAREQALRRFKEDHMGTLPEQTPTNLATLQRLQLEQQAVSTSLQAARDRLASLELSASGSALGSPQSELDDLRAQLAALRARYTDEHPEVRAMIARVVRAERALAARPAANPAAAVVQQQLAQARAEVESLKTRAAGIDRRIAALQARVDEAPRTEQLLSSLTRDYQKLSENYLTLLNKKLDAQMAQKLEQRWKGERFRVLDPAYLPEQPFYPNPTLFLMGGLALGLLAGLGLAYVSEFLDRSVKDAGELEDALPYPVLATVPHIARGGARHRRARPKTVPRARKAG
jgi:polysaccharide chain length determinant protein (PEP-CTERM system associated)